MEAIDNVCFRMIRKKTGFLRRSRVLAVPEGVEMTTGFVLEQLLDSLATRPAGNHVMQEVNWENLPFELQKLVENRVIESGAVFNEELEGLLDTEFNQPEFEDKQVNEDEAPTDLSIEKMNAIMDTIVE